MEAHERTLLAGALPCGRTILAYGLTSTTTEVLAALRDLCGSVAAVDVAVEADSTQLREEVRSRLASAPMLFMAIGPTLSDSVREILRDIHTGVLPGADTAEGVPDGARLLALSSAMSCSEEDARLFDIHVVGMRVLTMRRDAVAAAQVELNRRRERARQSSREHGLV